MVPQPARHDVRDGMDRRSTMAPGLRPLRLQALPPGFFDAPPPAGAPEPLALAWPARGGAPRMTGDAVLQAALREALDAYEAAVRDATLARTGGDVRAFFRHVTETHRRAAALEAFDLAPADLDRLQDQVRRRAQAAARRGRAREG